MLSINNIQINIGITSIPITSITTNYYSIKITPNKNIINKKFIYSSGSLKKEAILHEFIHHTIHPIVEKRKDEIAHYNFSNLNIDTSYYLDNDMTGRLNAFEEYSVRVLTDLIISGNIPDNLDVF